jgi:parvulin-like peptidyl-prolyl isomerase
MAMITHQEGMTVEIYKHDAVWPTIALRKLVGNKTDITQEDMQKGFEANYGTRVRCLAIVLNNQRKAQEVFEKARKSNTSDSFGDLAEQYSIEPGSRALRGEVPPIRKWGGQPLLEEEAFSLKQGELSGIVQVNDKFIILRCEEILPPSKVKYEDVKNEIYKDLFDKKIHVKMAECFDRLKDSAMIRNYLAGTTHTPKENAGPEASLNLPSVKQVPGRSAVR